MTVLAVIRGVGLALFAVACVVALSLLMERFESWLERLGVRSLADTNPLTGGDAPAKHECIPASVSAQAAAPALITGSEAGSASPPSPQSLSPVQIMRPLTADERAQLLAWLIAEDELDRYNEEQARGVAN